MANKKRLGIIGGLGPMATVHLFERIINFTHARKDQEHIDIAILNYPSIPDRTEYLLGLSKENPLPKIIEMAKKLEMLEMDFLAMPCITAHYFYSQIKKEIKIPLLDMIVETANDLNKNKYKKVAIMATTGTIKTNLFQTALENFNILPIIPNDEIQEKIMQIIYKNLKENLPADMDMFYDIQNYFIKEGAEQIILGCTELSIIKRDEEINKNLYTDAIDILAKTAIRKCGYKVLE
ncbi:MAG: amino acid racemase [Clostridiales Family XIII bacterium]|nr:amino acid racemase [Clostridiales Family XIII bacterium]